MFSSVGWGELLVLLVVGLVVLGPERLPGAIRWTSDALRKVRDYANGATATLRDELGPEFDDMREPIAELRKLRGMSPRAALTKHLLDGDDSVLESFTKPLGDVHRSVTDLRADLDAATALGAAEKSTLPASPAGAAEPGPVQFDADAT